MMDLFSQPPFVVHAHERGQQNQQILNANRAHFNKQMRQVFDLMMSGIRLTTCRAVSEYQIGDLRTRLSDFRKIGVHFTQETIIGRYKESFMTEEDIKFNLKFITNG